MKVFVKMQVRSCVMKADDVRHVREIFGKQMQHIMKSGKVTESGALATDRTVFFILEIEKPIELYELLGSLWDYCSIETDMIVPPNELGEYLAKTKPE